MKRAMILVVCLLLLSYSYAYGDAMVWIDGVKQGGSGNGDVTGVGDCTGGACYDGSADGGTFTKLYDGVGNYGEFKLSGAIGSDLTITWDSETWPAWTWDQAAMTLSHPPYANMIIRAATPPIKGQDSDQSNTDVWQIDGNSDGTDSVMDIAVEVATSLVDFVQLDGANETVDLLKAVTVAVAADITATDPGAQGDNPLTASVNEISTVGTADDAVTLKTAPASGSLCQKIINNGANQLEIWPASGDNCGAGVDTACTLAAGANVEYCSYDATNWEAF